MFWFFYDFKKEVFKTYFFTQLMLTNSRFFFLKKCCQKIANFLDFFFFCMKLESIADWSLISVTQYMKLKYDIIHNLSCFRLYILK